MLRPKSSVYIIVCLEVAYVWKLIVKMYFVLTGKVCGTLAGCLPLIFVLFLYTLQLLHKNRSGT